MRIQKIFEPYERRGMSRGIEGAGLGLAIVRETAQKHAGRAWVEPGQDKGATLYVSISRDLNLPPLKLALTIRVNEDGLNLPG